MANVLTWLATVRDLARQDTSPQRPSVQAIEAVALHRVLHANPDGSSCFPSQATLARLTERDRVTVRAVDRWFVDQDLMVEVRKRSRGLREYSLVVDPDGGVGHHLSGSVDGGVHHHLESDGGDDPPVGGLDGGPDDGQVVAATTTTFGPADLTARAANPMTLIELASSRLSKIGQTRYGRELEDEIPSWVEEYGDQCVRQVLEEEMTTVRYPSELRKLIHQRAPTVAGAPRNNPHEGCVTCGGKGFVMVHTSAEGEIPEAHKQLCMVPVIAAAS